jgi:hypothetical protein
MFQRDKIVNVFAGIGVVAVGLFTVLGLGVASGRLRVSVSRTKSEKAVEQLDVQTQSTNDYTSQ